MNVMIRKMAMFEKALNEKEKTAKEQGYVTSPTDEALKAQIMSLMVKIRAFPC